MKMLEFSILNHFKQNACYLIISFASSMPSSNFAKLPGIYFRANLAFKLNVHNTRELSSMGLCQRSSKTDTNSSTLSLIEENFLVLAEPSKKKVLRNEKEQASVLDCHESRTG